ncbi:MaoC family dehydratase [Hyphobacterium marinum]|uniref:MaoC family dehydratase n=1 Tax=Hyphobacterium marinum TaxID=3116574 RepID=A0ABU7LZM8_9PROT|nr:MaoC family dehydratase [Hyphobacterium sp. Y6023]MEE2566994.1 MaoC family dehydratase [Hyphobacterium sp. Y6023]
MPELLNLRERIGETFTSDWMEIDQARVDTFADTTLDHNFIHVDVERSKRETPFGGTIAHGFLSLSLLSHFGEQCLPPFPEGAVPINYGFDRLRFAAPVPVGSRIRGCFTFADVEQRKRGQYLMRMDAAVEIEGSERPALRAEWLTLLLFP